MNSRVDAPSHTFTAQFRERYQNALVEGNAEEARSVIEQCLASRVSVASIYLDIVCAAQSMLGELWQRNKVSVTQEHIGTEISLLQISWLRQQGERKPSLNCEILVTPAPCETHTFPARVVADLFYLDGWDVHFPGINIPEDDLIQFVSSRAIKFVAFSLTMPPSASFQAIVKKLKRLSPAPKLILGGRAAREVVNTPEIDLVALDLRNALTEARALTGRVGVEAGFNQLRVELGQRIAELRKSRRLSQQSVALAAEIDRTYLSALENGKQNPTISIIHRIAMAIGVSVPQLLPQS